MNARHRLNPRKLMLSKWTAIRPVNREKHFLVSEVFCDDDDVVLEVELQAVLTHRAQRLPWQALQDMQTWKMGWQ